LRFIKSPVNIYKNKHHERVGKLNNRGLERVYWVWEVTKET